MKCEYLIVLCYLPFFVVGTKTENYNSMQIKDLKITKCDNKDYPLTVNNVTVQLGTRPRVKISGSFSTEVDLVGPIKASVSIKRDVWGLWIKIPCEDNIGSCTYDDLCVYGYPKNETCPPVFIKNNVPCRCPIKKGNYTILPTIGLSQQNSLLSGTYKGSVTITQNEDFLACYDLYFVLYDESDLYSVIQVQ